MGTQNSSEVGGLPAGQPSEITSHSSAGHVSFIMTFDEATREFFGELFG